MLRFLRIQRKTRPAYASFKRISVTCNPNRIGRTAKEREIYCEAVRDLFNDKPKVTLKKILKARIFNWS